MPCRRGWRLVILTALSVGFVACRAPRARPDGGPAGGEDANGVGTGGVPAGDGGSTVDGTGGTPGGTGGNVTAGTGGTTTTTGSGGTTATGSGGAAGMAGTTATGSGGGSANSGGASGSPVDAGSLPSDEWATWPMPNPPGSGLPNPQRYVVSAETVLDEVTGLIWPRKVERRSLLQAAAHSYCETLVLAGRDDWRLPRAIDLLSLVDYTRMNPALSPSAFPDVSIDQAISSTVRPTNPGDGQRLTVTTDTGASGSNVAGAAWCVTGGHPHPTTPHYSVGADTVRDNWTGLTWQRTSGLFTFYEAQAYCSSLALEGGGWRLPSLNELQSLVDRTKILSVDTSAFPLSSEQFLTGSLAVPFSPPPEIVWMVIFSQGGWTGTAPKDATQRARCVR